MNKNIQWKTEVIDEKEGIIRLDRDSIKIPSQEEFKRKIEELLGVNTNSNKNLMDESNNMDLSDGMLLYMEMKDEKFQKPSYNAVITPGPRGDIILKRENYEMILESIYSNYIDHKRIMEEVRDEIIDQIH